MRTIAPVLVAAVLAPVVGGCSWLKNQLAHDDQVKGTGAIEPRPASAFVTHWNIRAARLQSLQYNSVHLKVSGKDIPVPVVNLDGNLAAAQGQNFRMTGNGRALAVKVDLGSNPNEFWMYLQVPGEKPVYYFSSHADFDAGRTRMPGGIPFDPDWVMQALGMVTLPENAAYEQVADRGRRVTGEVQPVTSMTVPRDEQKRTYKLAWEVRPAGRPAVRKEIIFAADTAQDPHPQVLRHLVKDLKGKVIATAEVKAARTVEVNGDPRQQVQYPTHVVLRWEEQKFEMDLNLEAGRERAVVNQLAPADAGRLFTRRDYPNVSAIDLAGGAFR